MSTHPKTSIIIPVYNAERFIAQCINSILSLNDQDWELILIDDGSTDRSAEICRGFAARDARIKSYSQRNAGASAARNAGLGRASGEWISFVDADDILDADFLDCQAEAPGYDMIYFGYKVLKRGQTADRAICSRSYSATEKIDDTLVDLFLSKYFYGYTVNKFYRRDIIERHGLRFDGGLTIQEDEEFIVRYCRYIKSLYISNSTAYIYRIRNDSVSHQGLRFINMTALARAMETDIAYYPWKRFEMVMRNRIYHYYKWGVAESEQPVIYNANLKAWLDYYDRNKPYIQKSDGYGPYINLPKGVREKVLTRRFFMFVQENPTPVIAVKRALYPCKVMAAKMIYRLCKPAKPHLRGRNLKLGANIRVTGQGRITIEDNVKINENISFCFSPINGKCPEIVLGKGVNLGVHNVFGCSERIEIGDYVTTAPHVHFTDCNQSYEDIGTPIMHQPASVKGPITIGRGSWLGFGVQIMSGVSVGKQCMVAAGSIVTKDIPDYCMVAGNPAKIIKRFNIFTGAWERV